MVAEQLGGCRKFGCACPGWASQLRASSVSTPTLNYPKGSCARCGHSKSEHKLRGFYDVRDGKHAIEQHQAHSVARL